MTEIMIAAAVVGIVGLAIGIFLGISGQKLHVEVDERESLIREQMPGNNCGGCGYAGCDDCAKAIFEGRAPVTACAGCGEEAVATIAKILGKEPAQKVKKVAYLKCSGDCDKAKQNYTYTGVEDCRIAAKMQNMGHKSCRYGCLGFGTCAKACAFGAITIVNGLPVIDESKCVGCGSCVLQCPKGLLAIKPAEAKVTVACSSKDKGKPVMDACSVGCIGCTLCVKTCSFGAITMDGNIPVIDYEKCTGCGQCAQKCPRHSIHVKK